MENKKVKIELILKEEGFSMMVKGNQKLSALELMGLASLLKDETTRLFEVDENIELSKEIEEASRKAPKSAEDFIQNILNGKGFPNSLEITKERISKCNCVSCRVMKGELKLTDFTKEDEDEIEEIALRENMSIENFKKQLTENYKNLHLSEENKSVEEFPNMIVSK